MAKSISSRTAILAVLASIPGWAQSTPAPVGQEAQKAVLDSIDQSLDAVESQARRSIFSGGSKPVSFAGEALLRFIGTSYDKYPGWMEKDRTENKNSFASVRVGMVAAPHRTLRLWSKIAFNAAILGYSKPGPGSTAGEGWQSTPQTGYFDPHSNILYEDMSAGLVAKTGPVTTSAKIGGTLWQEASPLTVWKGQPRMFGWDYVPYELEQSNAQYWEYATLKGEKTGRAAWNKKPFQGLMLESVEMPNNWAYSAVYGEYEGFQKWRENVPNPNNTNGLMYTGVDQRTFFTKGLGTGDGYRKTTAVRVSKAELPGAITLGLNYVGLATDNDYAKQWLWAARNGGLSVGATGDNLPVLAWSRRITDFGGGVFDTLDQYRSNYFLSHQTVSFDARRNLPGGLQFHVDIGVSQVDTSYFKVDPDGSGSNLKRYRSGLDTNRIKNGLQYEVVGNQKSGWIPAAYATASYPVAIGSKNYEFQLSSIYAPKKFYSGTSFIIPADIFFPFEANLLGAGKFASSDGGSPYAANMTGANLVVKFPVPNGHARLTSGFHKQIENGSDLLFLPWRLNGTAFKYSQNASTTQYDGVGLVDDYLRGNAAYSGAGSGPGTPNRLKQVHRFGDDFFTVNNPDGSSARRNPYAPAPGLAGGVRSDFMATYEGYGAFQMRKDSATRRLDSNAIADMMVAGLMPQSTKNTQNLSIDVAYDIARLWGGKSSVFLGAYGSLNSITKNGSPIPSMATDDKTLLSGTMLRCEAVVQVTPKFYLIGVAGRETWSSEYGVAPIDSVLGTTVSDGKLKDAKNWRSAPIDYLDWKLGAGFDWDMASRVGLHVRLERFAHSDAGISEEVTAAKGKNDFKAWLLHAETKMWF
jgi:hypothetical protein